MHDATFKMKDGTVHSAPIWEWKPGEGRVSLVGGIDINFCDVEEAYQNMRVDVTGIPARVDLLERARREGWKP